MRRRITPSPGHGSENTVHHFGPDVNDAGGGMATVLREIESNRLGADGVFVHPTWLSGRRATTALLTARAFRLIWSMPAGSVVHVHLSAGGSFVREGSLLWVARRRGLHTACTLHGSRFAVFSQRRPKLSGAVLRQSDLITTLNPEGQAIAQRLAPQALCAPLGNPVRIDSHSPSAAVTDQLVLFAGEVGHRKGIDVLAAAWPLVVASQPGARLIVAGPPTEFTIDPALQGVDVAGTLSPTAIAALLRKVRVVALPSRAEVLPMILLEAMAAARPFVATSVGGIPLLAESGGGTVVPAEDPRALAGALLRYLRDPAAAEQHGTNGQAEVRRKYSIEVYDRQLRDLYKRAWPPE